jgi:formylmethanofuran dehydrogenase subunit D
MIEMPLALFASPVVKPSSSGTMMPTSKGSMQ